MTEQEMIEAAIGSGGPLHGSTGQVDYQHTFYEANGQPYWKKVGGGKLYISPAAAMSMFDDPQALAWAKSQGYEIRGGRQGLDDASKGTVGPDGKTTYGPSPVTMADQGGGLWRTTGTWSGDSGKFESGFDWGNAFTMLVAAGMTAGAASAFISSAAAAGATPAYVTADIASTAAASQGAIAAGTLGAGAATGGAATLGSTAGTAGTTGAGATATGGMGTMATINGAVGSPLGQLAIGTVGSYLSSKAQSDQAEANRQLTAEQYAGNMTNQQGVQDRQNAVAAQTPLGENQNFAARNAMLNAILPNMRNISYAKGTGQGQGGMLPQGGLDPNLINSLYGATPTLESLTQRQNQLAAINPTAPKPNFQNLGFTQDQVKPFQTTMDQYQQGQSGRQDEQRKAVQQYINDNLRGQGGNLRNAIIGTGGY